MEHWFVGRILIIHILLSGYVPQIAGVLGRNTAPVPTFVVPMAIKRPLARCRHHQTVSAGSPTTAARAAAPAHGHVTACVIMEGLRVAAGVHALLGTKAHAAKHVRYYSICDKPLSHKKQHIMLSCYGVLFMLNHSENGLKPKRDQAFISVNTDAILQRMYSRLPWRFRIDLNMKTE